jgi:hypothetical protein
VIGYQLAVVARQVIDTFVDGAERARPARVVEVTAEALMSARGADADEIGQFLLFVLESCWHRGSPRAHVRAIDDRWACAARDGELRAVVHFLRRGEPPL